MSFLTLLNPDLPGQCDPSDVEKGGWFFHPSEYLAPCAAMTVPSVVALAWLFYGYSLYSPARQYKWRKPLSPRVRSTARLLQPFLCVLMVACWVFTCTLKVIKGGPLQAAYMLQPCHIVHAMLTFCTLSSSRLAHIVFDVALSWLFSVVLGIVANWDLSVYTVRFELENWILQHMLLLFLPFYYLYTHRFAPFGQAEFWFGHCLEQLAHVWVFLPISIILGVNVNYMLCPPSALGVVKPFYHYVAASGSTVLAIGLTLGFVKWYIRKIDGGASPSSERKSS